ncbi:hypothetical protein D8771_26545 [Streptomyces albus]|uniref:Uncharacterized protein n=1 Tax=Streptomyces albus TaxID=1888 RepID=A0A8H1QLC2_9ACTN|nr:MULTISPECIES: hypothetical protein [Streptomyces]TGG77860.1 hypothetical protein D8771_26545 [Streptomyces albus]TXJ73563.1 hypothetical protein E2C11_29055 [Streptomyces lavendulae]
MTDKTPAQLADTAGDAIRALNHATLGSPRPDWEYPGDAYSVVGNLAYMAGMLPQALEQIDKHIKHLEGEDRLKSDRDTLAADLEAAYDGLTIAAGAAETLRGALNRAQSGLSSIAYKE